MFLVITAWLGCQPDDATPAPASPEPCRAVDGPLAFTAAPALPGPSEGGALVAIGNRLVVAGGFDGESVVDTVWTRWLDEETWAPGPALPAPRQHLALLAVGARLYAIGGDTGDAHRDVWSAAIEPDGLGDWRDESPLRRPLAFMGAAALDGAIWLFGGFGRDTALSDRIFRGDVAFDGTLTWSAAGRIPDVRFAPGVAATAEEVWLLGGSDQTFSGSVRTWRAPHDADGLGAWEAGPDLVDGVMAPITAPLANGEVVVAGGFTGGDSVSAAWRLVDGAWEAYGALPTGRFSTYHAIAGGRMHTLGGWTGNFAEVLDDAWSSPLCAETP